MQFKITNGKDLKFFTITYRYNHFYKIRIFEIYYKLINYYIINYCIKLFLPRTYLPFYIISLHRMSVLNYNF